MDRDSYSVTCQNCGTQLIETERNIGKRHSTNHGIAGFYICTKGYECPTCRCRISVKEKIRYINLDLDVLHTRSENPG